MSKSLQRAAQQMARDGITRLHSWGKPVKVGWATVQAKVGLPHCEHSGCSKKARYSTPVGKRCFTHAVEYAAEVKPS